MEHEITNFNCLTLIPDLTSKMITTNQKRHSCVTIHTPIHRDIWQSFSVFLCLRFLVIFENSIVGHRACDMTVGKFFVTSESVLSYQKYHKVWENRNYFYLMWITCNYFTETFSANAWSYWTRFLRHLLQPWKNGKPVKVIAQ